MTSPEEPEPEKSAPEESGPADRRERRELRREARDWVRQGRALRREMAAEARRDRYLYPRWPARLAWGVYVSSWVVAVAVGLFTASSGRFDVVGAILFASVFTFLAGVLYAILRDDHPLPALACAFACLAVIGLSISAAALLHVTLGEQTTAVITDRRCDPDGSSCTYRAEDESTGQDLGELREVTGEPEPGSRVAVSVVPSRLASPTSVDESFGWQLVPGISAAVLQILALVAAVAGTAPWRSSYFLDVEAWLDGWLP